MRMSKAVVAAFLVVVALAFAVHNAIATEGDMFDLGGPINGSYRAIWSWNTNGTTYQSSLSLDLASGLMGGGTVCNASEKNCLSGNSILILTWSDGSCWYGRDQNDPCSGILYSIPNGPPCARQLNNVLYYCSGLDQHYCYENVTGSYSIGMSNPLEPTVTMPLTLQNTGGNSVCPPGFTDTINATLQFDCSDQDGSWCTENATLIAPSNANGAPVTGIFQYSEGE